MEVSVSILDIKSDHSPEICLLFLDKMAQNIKLGIGYSVTKAEDESLFKMLTSEIIFK